MQACACICIEVDLDKGLPETIKLKVDDWTHFQQLDYEQIPFKCKVCHKYGHFANRCTKLVDVEKTSQDEHWETIKKKKAAPTPKSNPEAGSVHNPPIPSSSSLSNPSLPLLDQPLPQPPPSSSNSFHILTPLEDNPSPPPMAQIDAPESPLPLIISSTLPPDPPSSLITRSNSKEHGATLDTQKRNGPGRKSAKQQRDENTQKDIAMGAQNPIESYILGQIDKDIASKEQGGRLNLCNPYMK